MKSFRIKLGLLALTTVLLHGVFGIYYITRDPALAARPSLHQSGEAYLASYPGWNADHEGDAAVYNRAAIEALRTGLPRVRSGAVFTHAPLYAYFLAACYGMGGVQLLPVTAGQALLVGLTGWLLGLAAWQLAGRVDWAGLAVAVLVLVNLRIAMYVAYINPAILLMFWTALACLAATRGNLMLFALAIGAGIFTQAAFFVVGAAAGGWLLWRARREHRWGPVVAAGGIGLLAVAKLAFSVWGLPADQEKQRDNPMLVLWEANNPYYESMTWTSLWERRPGNPWTRRHATAAEQRRFEDYLARAQQRGVDPGGLWIRENPAAYAKLCWIRFRTDLGPYTGQMSTRNRAISTFYWLLIFPAGAWGVWKYQRHPVGGLAIWIVLAIVGFDSLVIVEWYLRYRLPMDLILTLFAGLVYAGWLGRLSAPRIRAPAPSTH